MPPPTSHQQQQHHHHYHHHASPASTSKLTSPAPSYLSSFPHRPTQPTLTTALHRSNSHLDSLTSPPSTPSSSNQTRRPSPASSPPQRPHRQHSTDSSAPNDTEPDAAVAAAAAVATYRRILFAELPHNQPVPALSANPRLDDEIYLLLAFLLRATVLPWYSKLTPNRQLLTEIVSIINQVLQQLPHRLSVPSAPPASTSAAGPAWSSPSLDTDEGSDHADSLPHRQSLDNCRLHAFLGSELPLVLRQHYQDVRAARRKADSAWAPAVAVTASDAIGQAYDLGRSASADPPPLDESVILALAAEDEPEPPISPQRIAQLHAALCSHPGVDRLRSVQGGLDPAYLRIAVSSLLGSLLPAKDWAVETEKFIVRDVTVMVLRTSLGKCSRPWFLVQSIHKVLDVLNWPADRSGASEGEKADAQRRQRSKVRPDGAAAAPPSTTLLEHVFILVVRLWSLLSIMCTMVLPHLVRAYFDLFDPHASATASRDRRAGSHSVDGSVRLPSSSSSSTLTGRRQGSVRLESAMHGRYPSTSIGSGFLAGGSGGMPRRDAGAQHPDIDLDVASSASDKPKKVSAPTPSPTADYTVPWLRLLEEVTESQTRLLSSALFSLLKLGVGFAGFGRTLDRTITTKVNSSIKDLDGLASLVASIRKGAMPEGHLPPPVPDPSIEVQDSEWKRLRRRILVGVHPKVRVAMMGFGEEEQWRTVTRWFSPVCAPEAAGPNTHLAVMMLERVVVLLCPDLVEA